MTGQQKKKVKAKFTQKVLFVLQIICLLLVSFGAFSKALIEKKGSLEIDWTSLKVRFWGEAVGSSHQSWNDIESLSTKDALQKSYRDLAKIQIDQSIPQNLVLSEGSLGARVSVAEGVTRNAYVLGYDHFPVGQVKAHLESSLLHAFFWRNTESAAQSATIVAKKKSLGVIFQCQERVNPRLNCQVKPLHPEGVKHKEFFHKMTAVMASRPWRWLESPTMKEIATYEGAGAVRVPVRCEETGAVLVKESDIMFLRDNDFSHTIVSISVPAKDRSL
jgi:hypothetical protein